MVKDSRRNEFKERKEQARETIRRKLRELTWQTCVKETKFIEEQLETLSVYKNSRSIMFYWALTGEIDTKKLIRKAEKQGKIVTLPVVTDEQNMEPYGYTKEKDLIKNPLGVEEPDVSKSPRVSAKGLDLVLVPGIAFTKEGFRLGRGKGYYDRFLKRLSSKTYTIGLAFKCQLLDSLPFDSLRDEKVDLVISG